MTALGVFFCIATFMSMICALSIPFTQTAMMDLRAPLAASSTSECTKATSLYCCPSFIQSGEDGPCNDPQPIDSTAECRRSQPQGLACCIGDNELGERSWYCWSL
ncbi:hypothetical protein EJ04DRAFT_173572 [Polyplosphaeria fusca]|uniref:Uncharacterized protein n=1 Tax=Polyplosphaeria fusca TaxID=682080 RepID=A0A9P4UVE4_9PLEO|nr:hypothetical protein EJ04DRAFT_173572 [Polyplosphaeria fusca]